MNNQAVYERITGEILKKLRSGVIPWKASWKGVGIPRNGISKKPYRGVNILMLAMEQYDSPLWLTYKQARELGGSVITVEKGTPVIFWKWIEKSDEETKETKKVPVLKNYTVFNALQCEGLTIEHSGKGLTGISSCEATRNQRAILEQRKYSERLW